MSAANWRFKQTPHPLKGEAVAPTKKRTNYSALGTLNRGNRKYGSTTQGTCTLH